MDWSIFNTKEYWNKRIMICKSFNRIEIYNYTVSPATKTIHRPCSRMTKDLREKRKVLGGGLIIKTDKFVQIYEWPEYYLMHKKNLWYYGYKTYRKNSAMTKDLIKLEMMYRVYSFRPTFMDCALYKTKLQVLEGIRMQENMVWGTLLKDSSAEKN